MNTKIRSIALAVAAAAAFASLPARAQETPRQPAVPEAGISDVGSFEAIPYGMAAQILLRPDEKVTLRKLEDKHIQELRAIEDRFDNDLRTLRAKQQAEREAMLKAFAAKR
jgi:hypothetical protein